MGSNCPSETAGKPIKCKAAVGRKPGEPLVIEEIEVDPPKAWEVRIKILCTSLCHTDVTLWKMTSGPVSFFPRIFGHEAVGVVESVGEHVKEVSQGDVVVPFFHRNCEECRDCKSNKGNACSIFPTEFYGGMPRDGTSRFRDSNGEALHHFFSVSSFSEYTVVDVTHVVKISREVPVDKACLLSCGVTTGVGACWKVAQVEEGSTVAIFGLGAVGLAVAEGARLCGASKIIGVDLNSDKFEIGRPSLLFARVVFSQHITSLTENYSFLPLEKQNVWCHRFRESDILRRKISVRGLFVIATKFYLCRLLVSNDQVIREMTDGGADYCFECIGLASLMQDAFNSSRPAWGKTVILGVEMHGSPLLVNPYELLKGRTVAGSMLGGAKAKSDIPVLAQKYLNKELRLDGFITHEVCFEDINKAFDLLHQGKSLRCIIWMDK
ncbi:hypothetical protein RJ639_040845 [Escallonia herrerae]|uniref:Alcohol dehydrogenase n=1 Tax=Escallonia herrerae TaxID=1293975 RepID=A0AA88WFQ7_9ASTE|nr:hypothetical protein RJ639_040845 [Escallonia herrerae]